MACGDGAPTHASDARGGGGSAAAVACAAAAAVVGVARQPSNAHRTSAARSVPQPRGSATYSADASDADKSSGSRRSDERRESNHGMLAAQTLRQRSLDCGSATNAHAATASMPYTPLMYGTVIKHLIPRGGDGNGNATSSGSAAVLTSNTAAVVSGKTAASAGRANWMSDAYTTSASLTLPASRTAAVHLPSTTTTTTTSTYALRASPQLQQGLHAARAPLQARVSSSNSSTSTATTSSTTESSGCGSNSSLGAAAVATVAASSLLRQRQSPLPQSHGQKQHRDVQRAPSTDSYSSACAKTRAEQTTPHTGHNMSACAADGGGVVRDATSQVWRRSASSGDSAALLQHMVAKWSYTAEENKATYQEGGYLAVTLGSVLRSRYLIVRKLGWGVFSTVWLAHDTTPLAASPPLAVTAAALASDTAAAAATAAMTTVSSPPSTAASSTSFVAVKIARCEQNNRLSALYEVKLLRYLAARLPARAPVAGLLDSFRVTGAYGTHVCMVMPVLGANLLCMVDYMKARPRVRTWQEVRLVKHVIRSMLEGLAALSSIHVLHTDVKPENVLCAQPNTKMFEFMQSYKAHNGHSSHDGAVAQAAASSPTAAGAVACQPTLPPRHGCAWPDHLVSGRDANRDVGGGRETYTHLAMLADMGLSIVLEPAAAGASLRSLSPSVQSCLHELLETRKDYRVHTPGVLTNTCGTVIQTREYRAPEVLLGLDFTCTTDVWSVGCVAYELLTGRFLMDPKRYTRDEREMDIEHLAMMMQLIGPLPREIIEMRARRHHRSSNSRRDSGGDENDGGDGSRSRGDDDGADGDSADSDSGRSGRGGGGGGGEQPYHCHDGDLRSQQGDEKEWRRSHTRRQRHQQRHQPAYLHRYVDERGNFIYADRYHTYTRRQLHKELLPYLGSTEAAMEAASFVLTCLYSYDPHHRPSAQRMLAHPWLRDVM